MITLEELNEAKKKALDLVKWINAIVINISDNELSLLDVEAEEESLDNRCYELKEEIKKIVKLRMWLGFEQLESEF